jgi:ankyrin repeat protein
MSQSLPPRPSLEHLKKQAKDLLGSYRSGEPSALEAIGRYFPSTADIGLAEAQLTIARQYGYASWPALARHVEQGETPTAEAFIDAVLAGRLDEGQEWWATHRSVLREHLPAATLAGEYAVVEQAIAEDPKIATQDFPPLNRSLLTYACRSRLANAPDFSDNIVRVADLLLKSGSDPNKHYADAEYDVSIMYWAAGVLNHPGLTKLLLAAGADPNDGESLFHSSEHPGHNECVRLILEANPTQAEKDQCFKRKLSFEDIEGINLYLDYGANPNHNQPRTALGHAIYARRSLEVVRLLLDRGADPNVPDSDGTKPYALAKRLGDQDLAALLVQRGAREDLSPLDALLAAVAAADDATIRQLTEQHPKLTSGFKAWHVLPEDSYEKPYPPEVQMTYDMARLGEADQLRCLLDLGVRPDVQGPTGVTPLHFACIAGRPHTTRLLLERGADPNAPETSHGSNPISWAMHGSIYWDEPAGDYAETIRALLHAGAKPPEHLWGSDEVKEVLREAGVQD